MILNCLPGDWICYFSIMKSSLLVLWAFASPCTNTNWVYSSCEPPHLCVQTQVEFNHPVSNCISSYKHKLSLLLLWATVSPRANTMLLKSYIYTSNNLIIININKANNYTLNNNYRERLTFLQLILYNSSWSKVLMLLLILDFMYKSWKYFRYNKISNTDRVKYGLKS